jgi:hypothetical protein
MAKRQREDYESSSAEPETPIIADIAPTEASGSVKIVHLDSGSGETVTAMQCSLPPHKHTLSFGTYEEYEVHYTKAHVNRCLECRKNFPTDHFLNLHILENHDALVSVKKERGDKTVGLLCSHSI